MTQFSRHPHRMLYLALLLSGLTGPAWTQQIAPGSAQSPTATETTPGATRLTAFRDTLWDIAGSLVSVQGPTRAQAMVAILRANPDAFLAGNMHRLRQGVTLSLPSLAAIQTESDAKAAALVEAHLAALDDGRPLAGLPPLQSPLQTPLQPPLQSPPLAAATGTPASSQPPDAATPPASAIAVVPAAAADSSVQPPARAPDPPATPAPASSPTGSGTGLAWAVVVAVVCMLVLGGLWLARRRSAPPQDAQPSTFIDEDGIRRRRRPRVLEVSQAAADVAREVETLRPVTQLVRSTSASEPAPLSATSLRDQAALKLALARAYQELGRIAAAQALLLEVLREGSLDLQAEAAELSARLS